MGAERADVEKETLVLTFAPVARIRGAAVPSQALGHAQAAARTGPNSG